MSPLITPPSLLCHLFSLPLHLLNLTFLPLLSSLPPTLPPSQGCISSPGWYLLSRHFFAKRQVAWQSKRRSVKMGFSLSVFHLFSLNGGIVLWLKIKYTPSGNNSHLLLSYSSITAPHLLLSVCISWTRLLVKDQWRALRLFLLIWVVVLKWNWTTEKVQISR